MLRLLFNIELISLRHNLEASRRIKKIIGKWNNFYPQLNIVETDCAINFRKSDNSVTTWEPKRMKIGLMKF